MVYWWWVIFWIYYSGGFSILLGELDFCLWWDFGVWVDMVEFGGDLRVLVIGWGEVRWGVVSVHFGGFYVWCGECLWGLEFVFQDVYIVVCYTY